MPLNSFVVIFLLILIGILGSIIARMVRLPRALLFITLGMIIQFWQFKFGELVNSSEPLFHSIALGVLVFCVLDHALQLNLHEWTSFTHGFFRFTVIRMLLTIIGIGIIAHLTQALVLPAILVGLLVCAGAPELLRKKHSQEALLFNVDATISSSLSITGVFLLIVASRGASVLDAVRNSVVGFFITIATGFFIGLLFYRLIRLSGQPFARLSVFLLGVVTFVLGERFAPGLGVLATLSFGLMLANAKLPQELLHGSWITGIAESAAFVLLGISIPFSQTAWLAGILLLTLIIVARYLAIIFTQPRMHKAMVCLSNPLGMPVAATSVYLATTLPYLQHFFLALPVVIFLSLVLHCAVNYPLAD